jgi:lipopolysaccharide/colanic/teichoic acid biosynthesis glycosyltransferase
VNLKSVVGTDLLDLHISKAELLRWQVPAAQAASSVAAPRGVYVHFLKRAVDVALATLTLWLLWPLMLVVAASIRVCLGKGVLLRQSRVGRGGHDFEMLKFRTMRPDRRARVMPFEGPERRLTHKSSTDPRHTRLGRCLRRYSLDELPQLFNVFRGDMSMVGPRPEISAVVDQRGLRGHRRHCVRPGLTGQWQVNVRRDGSLLIDGFDVDLTYVDAISLRSDIHLLLGTATVLMHGAGR